MNTIDLSGRLLCILLFHFTSSELLAQKQKVDQSLPVIFIQTGNQEISSDKRIQAAMTIIGKSQFTTGLDSQAYAGKIEIETRGETSKNFPQKSYAFSLDENDSGAPLLQMPSDKDWILSSTYNDKSLIRNVLMYDLAREMGHYAARTVYVDLFLNNHYEGIYVLTEKIKRSSQRVNSQCVSNPVDGKSFSGYILKIDKPDGRKEFLNIKTMWKMMTGSILHLSGQKKEIRVSKKGSTVHEDYIQSAYSPPHATWQKIQFRFDDPKAGKVSNSEKNMLKDFLQNAESSIYNRSHYEEYFDMNALIDYFILSEVSKNVDAYRLSTYFYVDSCRKITMGPVWDFDRALSNSTYCDADNVSGWAYEFNSCRSPEAYLVPMWWEKLMSDSAFKKRLSERWNELSTSIFNPEKISGQIDSLQKVLASSSVKSYCRWHPDITAADAETVFQSETEIIKNWFRQRISWMNNNIK